jgi:hypothetical protein
MCNPNHTEHLVGNLRTLSYAFYFVGFKCIYRNALHELNTLLIYYMYESVFAFYQVTYTITAPV